MRSDLHIHSRYSDGTLWPSEVAASAKQSGLEQAALTDHDCMEGVPEFLEACRSLGLSGVAGVEIDCAPDETGLAREILAYFPSGAGAGVRELLRRRLEERRRAVEGFLSERFPGARGAVEAGGRASPPPSGAAWAGGGAFEDMVRLRLGSRKGEVPETCLAHMRPHLLRYLLGKGLLPPETTPVSFKEDYPCSMGRRPLAGAAAALAREDGGLPVLAHPGFMFPGGPCELLESRARLDEDLRRLRDAGLWGVELYPYRDKDVEERVNGVVSETAASLGLRLTAGSDHHGPAREDEGLGVVRDTLGKFYRDLPSLAG